ncbi:hypothetical protein GGX14DRAFT_701907 [Mycena pura]|uniref:Uncharacterized protein n=1 Tax=Mycena pura TaxID=153505 RepID=A0AAD6ULV7_9AGAR|nr:hypothetical protein GGX14DRAFT_701907 [Mycena pura]
MPRPTAVGIPDSLIVHLAAAKLLDDSQSKESIGRPAGAHTYRTTTRRCSVQRVEPSGCHLQPLLQVCGAFGRPPRVGHDIYRSWALARPGPRDPKHLHQHSAFTLFVGLAVNKASANIIPNEDTGLVARQGGSVWEGATWSWANNVDPLTGFAPIGNAVFRVTLPATAPVKSPLVNISISITVDNGYSLYLNGTLIGNGVDFDEPDLWVVGDFDGSRPAQFTVLATNYADAPNPAGFIGKFEITSPLDPAAVTFVTGPGRGWKVVPFVPDTFTDPSLDDSSWPDVIGEGQVPVGPWGAIPNPVLRSLCV